MKHLSRFDADFYRAEHGDLRSLADDALQQHYENHGMHEGRLATEYQVREKFLELLPSKEPVLEIGPFVSPALKSRNTRYFDVLDTAGLKARARSIGLDEKHVPKIDYVDPKGDLSVVDVKMRACFSSHCIEHQPDLIHHLNQVAAILKPGGQYFLLIPDKRFCFDHFIAESTIASVLQAHSERRRVHTLASVIEHRALTTHNDINRHWAGDHADPGWETTIAERTRSAIAEYDAADGGYVDVHAWQFTPGSFRRILTMLHSLHLITMKPAVVFETPRNRNEFAAILQRDE